VRKEVQVAGYQWPVPGPQKPSEDIPNPPAIDIGLMGPQVMKTVYREGQLYATWNDCANWLSSSTCVTSIRLLRVDVSGFPYFLTKTLDYTFGQRHFSDPPGAVSHYGWPTVEVNKDANIVVGFTRVGDSLFLESRYSVFYANDSNISWSHLVEKGQSPIICGCTTSTFVNAGFSKMCEANYCGRADLVGSALDPDDDTSIWVALHYAGPAGDAKVVVRRITP
jgi:hypothetical protein